MHTKHFLSKSRPKCLKDFLLCSDMLQEVGLVYVKFIEQTDSSRISIGYGLLYMFVYILMYIFMYCVCYKTVKDLVF